ncbi:imidazolonepropionase-like amidohydrolase [Dyadobacter jejuensis]|uniref:Imidazolonepropionase-like amidohydrolase n=1 Tax=Dyadobacter jejuensis TaxID=1082580 RepID=A0A316A4L9_9BACT|nr:imidazolonepropionase-like amidohydrolase [Dyadobacter jejuensis]
MRFMKVIKIVVFVFFYCSNVNGQAFIFKNISIVSPDQNSILKGQNVLINNGKIEKIGPGLKAPKRYQKIDGAGKFLMAGMADMHVHLPAAERDIISTKHFLLLQLIAGVTTVRSMRGSLNHIALRDSVKKGMILSPDLYLSAPPIYSSQKVAPDSIDELILAYKNVGFDFIKILSLPNSLVFYDSLLAAANRYQMPVVGHAPWGDVQTAIKNKQRSIEHLQGYASLKGDTLNETIRKTKVNNIYNCPTLDWTFVGSLYYSMDYLKRRPGMEYLPLELRKKWEKTLSDYIGKVANQERKKDSLSLIVQLDIVRQLKAEGCKFLLSQDASNVFQVPGFGLLEEMKLFKKAGFSNHEILVIATQNPAQFFGESDRLGAVRTGFKANLIMLAGNPLEDIENIKKVDGILLGEQWHTREFLEGQIKTYLR